MIGEFIINILVLVFGYAYPTFESFRIIEKTIERKRPDTERLLFWCQYWVIIAMITGLEKFGDIFVSWVPFYGESKLAFIIYLWHPKTKGTEYVYSTVVRPFMAQHETDIEKRLQGMMNKSIDLLIFYLKHCTDKGQSIAFEIFQQVVSRSMGGSSIEDLNTIDNYKASERRDTSWKKSLFKRSANDHNSDVYVSDDELRLKRIQTALFPNGVNLTEISRLQQPRKR